MSIDHANGLSRRSFVKSLALAAAIPRLAWAGSATDAGTGAARMFALADISLVVEPGTALGIIGAPGSGKSTLIKLILGVERPSEGRVLLDDLDLAGLAPMPFS